MATYNTEYLGVGEVSVRDYGTLGPLLRVGNVTNLVVTQELETFTQPNRRRPGGGNARRIDRVSALKVDITFGNASNDNWALALAASQTAVASATITDELAVAYKGSVVKLAHPPSSITSVAPASTGSAYAAGTDYQLTAAGLYIPEGSAITNASGTPPTANIKVTYEAAKYARLEAGTRATRELEFLFEGLNEADSLRPFVVEFWRLMVPPATQIALISENLDGFTFTCEALPDTTKGGDVSSWMRARQVQPA